MAPRRQLGQAALALLLGAGSGCAQLTFSNEAEVDFERYPSVAVDVAGPDGSRRQLDYLESELREHSGFRRVSRVSDGEPAATRLLVELTLDASQELILFDDDDQVSEISYSAEVRYRLFAPDGALLDSGADLAEDEQSSFHAAEAALDLVVLHYLRPYRL